MTAATLVELRPGITGGRLAVGVAELTGLRAIRRFLDIPHRAHLQSAFDAAWRRVLAAPDTLIASRGDAIAYAVSGHADAVDIATALVAEAALDALLPPVRVGVASGTVLLSGDRWYGPAVDAATQRMGAAAPGTVNHRDTRT
jgi:adenylate cyclase